MTYRSEKYGRYEIRSGPLKGRWGANAYRGKSPIAKEEGADRDEALSKLRQQLDRLDAIELSERDADGAPSAAVYEQAFLAIEPISDGYRAMLRAHLHADDHLISATRLAEAADYKNYSAANLHYGSIGRMIAQQIGYDPPRRDDGTEIWTYAIAKERGSYDLDDVQLYSAIERQVEAPAPHFEWLMRPQVVELLSKLGY